MKLSEIKKHLEKLSSVNFQLPDGTMVPTHFHVTEVGQITKNFIDCGGTVRSEKKVNFQLWEANDFDHRLAPKKLLNIIELSETVLNIEDVEVEVEYQSGTIGKYDLGFNDTNFLLLNTQTDCLAIDRCGVAPEKLKVSLSELSKHNSCCDPKTGCCL